MEQALWEPISELAVGRVLRSVRSTLSDDDKGAAQLDAWEVGVATCIDNDGDAKVYFPNLKRNVWVMRHSFEAFEVFPRLFRLRT